MPGVTLLAAAGIDVVGDIELFARAARAPVVGITGSNGKSTVTTLVGEMARASGIRVAGGGNLGTPALDLLSDDVQLYVLELSSFQLETTRSLRCVAATILNLSQDHLDRHGTMAHYGAVKARIFDGCTTAVANRDDAEVMALTPEGAVTFGLDAPERPLQYGLVVRDGMQALGDQLARFALPLAELKIFGLHNAANALAAHARDEQPHEARHERGAERGIGPVALEGDRTEGIGLAAVSYDAVPL